MPTSTPAKMESSPCAAQKNLLKFFFPFWKKNCDYFFYYFIFFNHDSKMTKPKFPTNSEVKYSQEEICIH